MGSVENRLRNVHRQEAMHDAAREALWVGQPVRIRPDPLGIAWCWGAVQGCRGSVLEIHPAHVRVRLRKPRAAAGRVVNVSPLLLLALPSKARR